MITILAVSDGYKHFDTPITEYTKRMQKYAKIQLIKPISHTNSEYIRVKETLLIQEHLKKFSGTIILCDERGKSLSTREFTEMLEDTRDRSEDITFIIG